MSHPKLLAMLFLLVGSVSAVAQAETYECYGDLSAYGRPGQFEITTYERITSTEFKVKTFINEDYRVAEESSGYLLLTRHSAGDISVHYIDKKNLRYVGAFLQSYLDPDDIARPISGNCVLK